MPRRLLAARVAISLALAVSAGLGSASAAVGADDLRSLMEDAKQTISTIKSNVKLVQEKKKEMESIEQEAKPAVAQLQTFMQEWTAKYYGPCHATYNSRSEYNYWDGQCDRLVAQGNQLKQTVVDLIARHDDLSQKIDALKASIHYAHTHVELIAARIRVNALLRQIAGFNSCAGRTPREAEVQCYIVIWEGGSDPGWTVPDPAGF